MNEENANYNENIAAVTKIFEEHGEFIRKIISYKTTDKSLIDDLYQDLFLSLAANPVALTGPELKAFLYRSIINDIHDSGRRVKNYRNLLNKYAENHKFSVNKHLSQNAYNEERVEIIMKDAWGKLSPKETNAISLRYIEGYSIAETASIMRVKPASVSRYICVGLKKLRECLGHTERDCV
ncbi:MAG: sigma-70 family RNA polymerase sigma factor [Phycisphaerae bacterium]